MKEFLHKLGIHNWEYIFPKEDTTLEPYKKCTICNRIENNGNPCRWFIDNNGEWQYDDADYGPPGSSP